MAKFCNPILFSSHFNVDPDTLDEFGLIDPFLNVDLELFIDPVLLEKSSNPRISKDAIGAFRTHFSNLVRLLAISEAEDGAAWKGARKLLNLSEPSENGLGYGGASRSGSSRSREIQTAMLKTTKDVITLGSKDPEMISLMGFFEKDVGPDTISDLTTQVIFNELATITSEFCIANGVKTELFKNGANLELPVFTDLKGNKKPFLLVPQDIVRDLPIANDWSEVQEAAMQNSIIRGRFNQLLAGIIEPTITQRKSALKGAALSTSEIFQYFLAIVKDKAICYDMDEDDLGYFQFRNMLTKDNSDFIRETKIDVSQGPEAIKSVVLETIDMFRHHVENGNLWEELWATKDKPKLERAAQLIYFAMADAFCKANNIDISPEANMGGGPVDFKFSQGYNARVLVEIKRDRGTVRHGYETQLEHYKKASKSFFGIFVVLDFGKMGNKLEEILALQSAQIAHGERASEIIVIDARRKKSASKK
jgi:hypothetical protein